MKLTTCLIRGSEISHLHDQWDALYSRDPEAQFFQSRTFIEPIVTRRPEDYAFLTVCSGEELLGLVALWAKLRWDENRACFRTDLLFAGAKNWADYNAPLVCPSHEANTLEAMALEIKDMHWGRLRLKNLRMSPGRRQLFLEAFEGKDFGSREVEKIINKGTTNNLLCPAIPLPETFDDYLGNLSRNTRQKLRRLLRKLDEGAFTVRYGQTREDLETFMDLWTELWSKKKDRERLARTYARTLMDGMERGSLSMPMLMRDDKVLGVLANFIDPIKRTVSFFVSARDPAVRDTPIGLMMHAHEIRRFINEGYQTYDMLRGDEPYKIQLGGQITPIRYTVIRRRSHVDDEAVLSGLSAHQLETELGFLEQDSDVEIAEIARRQLVCLSEVDVGQ